MITRGTEAGCESNFLKRLVSEFDGSLQQDGTSRLQAISAQITPSHLTSAFLPSKLETRLFKYYL